MMMEQTECFETSENKIQTPENYPEESIKLSEQRESLKSRIALTSSSSTSSSEVCNSRYNIFFLLGLSLSQRY